MRTWQLSVTVVATLAALSLAPAFSGVASAATGGYPYWDMPCEHSPYATTGLCPNYDWGPTRNGSEQSTYDPTTGYGYRNCTDWVAFRLHQLGIPLSKIRGLHNGGQWAQYAPNNGLSVSTTPRPGDAAVSVGNPGHVAFVEAVNGNTITVSQYNAARTGAFSEVSGTPASLGFQKFVHFGANPAATPISSSTPPPASSTPAPASSTPAPANSTPAPPASGPAPASAPPAPAPTYAETAGSVVHTWTDPSDAGGGQGPDIPAGATVQIACTVSGFTVSDGNSAWYLIAASPWSGGYYASADAFYNNGATSGGLSGTPFVDPAVPTCSGGVGSSDGSKPAPPPPPPPTYAETSGSVVHTWTDYSDAGGSEGPTIPSNDTVQIQCKVNGFTVADGNTWWYRLASSPWSGSYYGSADAFYNDGATSGSLRGTPFDDAAVPNC